MSAFFGVLGFVVEGLQAELLEGKRGALVLRRSIDEVAQEDNPPHSLGRDESKDKRQHQGDHSVGM